MARNMEECIMNLIVLSGESRSLAFEAMQYARERDFAQADEKMKESAQASIKAHEMQTELLQDEVGGNPVPVSLMMIHAQDHLMDSLLARDLVAEIIQLRKELAE